jgi:hypothetical protein
MIREADAQLWIEMMQEQPNAMTTIFIHDGMIAKESEWRTSSSQSIASG